MKKKILFVEIENDFKDYKKLEKELPLNSVVLFIDVDPTTILSNKIDKSIIPGTITKDSYNLFMKNPQLASICQLKYYKGNTKLTRNSVKPFKWCGQNPPGSYFCKGPINYIGASKDIKQRLYQHFYKYGGGKFSYQISDQDLIKEDFEIGFFLKLFPITNLELNYLRDGRGGSIITLIENLQIADKKEDWNLVNKYNGINLSECIKNI